MSNVLSNAGTCYISKKSEPSGSTKSVELHNKSSTATSPVEQINTNVVLTGKERVGPSGGTITVLATEPVEPPLKYPRLQVYSSDPLLNSSPAPQETLTDAQFDLMLNSMPPIDIRFDDDLENVNKTPSLADTSEEEEFDDLYFAHFKKR